MKKIELIEKFLEAKEHHAKFIGVEINLGTGYKMPEVIINRSENFDDKMKYYMKSYDDDLKLNFNKEINIKHVEYADTYYQLATRLNQEFRG